MNALFLDMCAVMWLLADHPYGNSHSPASIAQL